MDKEAAFLSSALLLVLCLMMGCSSSQSAYYRVFPEVENASPVSVWVDGKLVAASVPFNVGIGPTKLAAGSHAFEVLPAGASPGPPFTPQTFTLTAGTQSTIICGGPTLIALPGLLQLTDDTTAAGNSEAKLRVLVDAAVLPSLDIYVVPSGTNPSGKPTFPNLSSQIYHPTRISRPTKHSSPAATTYSSMFRAQPR